MGILVRSISIRHKGENMSGNIDPQRLLRGKLSQGLWTHFCDAFKPLFVNDDLIFALGVELIHGGVFEIVDGSASGEELTINVSLNQLKFISNVTDQVLSTRTFRGTPVNIWGKEVVRRVRATQLLCGPNDFKITVILKDQDREKLIADGSILLGPDRLELPITMRIEVDQNRQPV